MKQSLLRGSALLLLLQQVACFTAFPTPSRFVTSQSLAIAAPSSFRNGTQSSDDVRSMQITNFQEMNRWADAIESAPTAQLAVQAATFVEQIQQQESDVISFNTALKGWARCGQRLTELRHHHMAPRGDAGHTVNWDLLETKGIHDKFAIYTPRDAVEHASALLESHADKVPANAQSYNIVMDAWSKLKNTPDAVDKIHKLLKKTPEPDVFAYNSLIEAYSSSSTEEGLEKAVNVFNKLPMEPNSHTYNSVLHAYSKRASIDYLQAKECALAAEKLLSEAAKSQKADVMSYTSVMECWSRVNDGASHAEAILERFKATVKPSVYTYNVLMQAYRRPNNVKKAKALIEQLLAAVEKPMKSQDVKANAIVCTTYLSVLKNSRTDSQAVDALRLIQRMNELSVSHPAITPSLVTYNAALEVCAQVPESKGTSQLVALKISFALLKSLEQHKVLKPNNITYNTLLRAISSLLPMGSQERDQVSKALFEKAKAAGQVDTYTLKNLQRAASVALYADVVAEMEGGTHFSADSPIPASWSRNVRL
ncbi:hypothetical protein FisN_5Lh089 [Fistulifera solaris]|uniref:Pentacotripeptide-repeat region of PRORP domain-containing protein n=1 Tax=Fistulifera solaris TaxID=1519565 RepID=A0A1Z5JJN1_FISSO|nr:hypothetical protein FisN_5Lh089 [Fistulifera solaris]|eukprot:GAX13998.1 hypothetical protein FisN_5Lh089 [Fistulifera solaris]